MPDHKGFGKGNGKSKVKTSVLNLSYDFSWEIENFPEWPQTFNVTSSEFQPADGITLYATFERFVDTSGTCKSYLKLISKGTISFEVKYYHSILDSAGKILQDVRVYPSVYDYHKKIHELNAYPELIKEFSKSTEDQIVIFKWVMEFSGLTTENISTRQPKSSSDFLPTLVENFKSMFVYSLYTDLSLLVDNSTLHVHKSVLCARSPVFAKMLISPMDEREKDVIKIPDSELPIVKSFIEFLYTGNLPDAEFENVCALYYVADKYDVPSLRKACSGILVAQLDTENACGVLSLANRHNDEKLKDMVIDYMNFEFEAILGSESFTDFVKTETELAAELMKLCCKKFEKRGHQIESA